MIGAMAPAKGSEPKVETVAEARRLLRGWLGARLAPPDLAWLDGASAAAAGDGPARRFYMDFSAACRHAGKRPLQLADGDRAAAEHARPGWTPAGWTEEQAARTLLLLSRDARDADGAHREREMLFEHGDLGELVALYQALPLLPGPDRLPARCAEGIRSNMTDVLRAVAHRNPFPAERLPEAAWNQMVLKALFVEVGLGPVVGLDARMNPTLARMLRDYAAERRAAHRPVSPELLGLLERHEASAGKGAR